MGQEKHLGQRMIQLQPKVGVWTDIGKEPVVDMAKEYYYYPKTIQ